MHRDNLTEIIRKQLRRLPAPYAAHYGVVPPPPPETAIKLGSAGAAVEAAERALVEADVLAREITDAFLLSRVLSRSEAVSSSAIEGTNSTLAELLSSEEDDGPLPAPTGQVRDYALALESLLPRANQRRTQIFSLSLIRKLHKQVMKSNPDYPDRLGRLRKAVVWIGGSGDISTSTYNPTPPNAIEACLVQHVDYLRAEGMHALTQGLITRMGIAHAHFEAIHPFRDGNGRVGRLLLPLMMAAEHHVPLYLSPYIETNKEDYYAALRSAQQRLNWSAIVGFLAEAVVATLAEIKQMRTDLAAMSTTWHTRRRFRADAAALRAMKVLPEYPVVTIRRLESLLDVSFPAAAAAVKELVEIGILTERTGYKRNRVFVAEEALAILNRPLGRR